VRGDLTLGDILRRAAAPQRHGAKPALIRGEETYTYADLNGLANRAAHALLALSVGRGDRVAVLARNCPEYVWLYFALAKIGAILVPVNFWYRAAEIEYTLRQSGATYLLLDSRFLPVAQPAIEWPASPTPSRTYTSSRPTTTSSSTPAVPPASPRAPCSRRRRTRSTRCPGR
jgi:fatty-acyl-CoA synthase